MAWPDTFPILGTYGEHSIPWSAIASHEAQAVINHDGQSLAVLARRGGLSWCEALAVLEDRRWRKMPEAEARAAVLARCAPPADETKPAGKAP